MRAGLTTLIRPGVCRECGCTALRACVIPGTDEGCSWVDPEQTRCNVCALILGNSWFHQRESWQPAREPMITGRMPIEIAIALVIHEARAGFLVHVCSACQDPELRAELTAAGMPNISHGLCPGCLDLALAELGELPTFKLSEAAA
jgi:hypothetical protein